MPFIFFSLVLPWLVSLLACIYCARYMKMNVGLAAFLGILLSPGVGLFYAYMAISKDRNPWRIAVVCIGIWIVLIGMLVMVLNYSKSSTNSNKPIVTGSLATTSPQLPDIGTASKLTLPKNPSTIPINTKSKADATENPESIKSGFFNSLLGISKSFDQDCLGGANLATTYAKAGDTNLAADLYTSSEIACAAAYRNAYSLYAAYENQVPTSYIKANYYLLLASSYMDRSLIEFRQGNYDNSALDAQKAITSDNYVKDFFSSL